MSQIATLLDGRIQYLEHDLQLWIVVALIDADPGSYKTKVAFVVSKDEVALDRYIEDEIFTEGAVNLLLSKRRVMDMFADVSEAQQGGVW